MNVVKRLANAYDLGHFFLSGLQAQVEQYPGKVVFVCKGNVCRSVMAEHISRQCADKRGIREIVWVSRGLHVSQDNPAEPEVIKICKLNRMDVSQHRSTALEAEDVNDADLVVAMEYGQLKELLNRYPTAHRKICLLPLFSKSPDSMVKRIIIHDPYGGSGDQFEQCYAHISQSLIGLFDAITAVRTKG